MPRKRLVRWTCSFCRKEVLSDKEIDYESPPDGWYFMEGSYDKDWCGSCDPRDNTPPVCGVPHPENSAHRCQLSADHRDHHRWRTRTPQGGTYSVSWE